MHWTYGVIGSGAGGSGGEGGVQPFCQIACPSSPQLAPGKVCVWPFSSTYSYGGMMSPQPFSG